MQAQPSSAWTYGLLVINTFALHFVRFLVGP